MRVLSAPLHYINQMNVSSDLLHAVLNNVHNNVTQSKLLFTHFTFLLFAFVISISFYKLWNKFIVLKPSIHMFTNCVFH